MYNKANSREKYYHMLAQEIFELQKELERIKTKQKNEKRALERILEEEETCGICLDPFHEMKTEGQGYTDSSAVFWPGLVLVRASLLKMTKKIKVPHQLTKGYQNCKRCSQTVRSHSAAICFISTALGPFSKNIFGLDF